MHSLVAILPVVKGFLQQIMWWILGRDITSLVAPCVQDLLGWARHVPSAK